MLFHASRTLILVVVRCQRSVAGYSGLSNDTDPGQSPRFIIYVFRLQVLLDGRPFTVSPTQRAAEP